MLHYEITAALMFAGRTCGGLDGASQPEDTQMRGISGPGPVKKVNVSVLSVEPRALHAILKIRFIIPGLERLMSLLYPCEMLRTLLFGFAFCRNTRPRRRRAIVRMTQIRTAPVPLVVAGKDHHESVVGITMTWKHIGQSPPEILSYLRFEGAIKTLGCVQEYIHSVMY